MRSLSFWLRLLSVVTELCPSFDASFPLTSRFFPTLWPQNMPLLGLQVKYERAGSRANKLLQSVGISLPEAQGNRLLLGPTSSGSGGKLLVASDTKGVPSARISGSNTVAGTPAVRQSTAAKAKEKLLREASARLRPTPPAPDPFRAVRRVKRKGANAQGQRNSSDVRVAESKVDSVLANMLTSRLDVVVKELLNSVQAVDDETRLRQRGVKAANAVLCSTEPVVAGLEESLAREVALLEELNNLARNVQQTYVLAEMTEAVEAAEAYLERLEGLSAHVVELASELRAYVATANFRYGHLESQKRHQRLGILIVLLLQARSGARVAHVGQGAALVRYRAHPL